MNSNGISEKHWLDVSVRVLTDALLFWAAFLLGTEARLGTPGLEKHLIEYLPSIIWAGISFPCAIYICGLYSPHSVNQTLFRRSVILAFCFLLALGFMMALFYINFSGRIGRGVLIISSIVAYIFTLLHHFFLHYHWKNFRERVALIVSCAFDEAESELLESFLAKHLHLVGVIHYDNFTPANKNKILGQTRDIYDIVHRHKIDRVLCTENSLTDPALCREFCKLRYSGVVVMPLISLCEEVYQTVPLELITPQWLLNASGSPHMLYIKKVKRAFDIIVSLLGLLFLGPFMLLGMLLTKLTSPGPVFYYQTRAGRFGRPMKIIKLRTMRVDAEKNGAVWSSKNDSRVTPVGGFLRKYRIDEIPQIINVLRGEMSFVGPRPERPEFIEKLAAEIPHFSERLMVQPGITGWAQVNYPYGASVADARRKLELDLYYTKNMALFLDVLILLDTVRIIFTGGVKPETERPNLDTAMLARAAVKNKALEKASLATQ